MTTAEITPDHKNSLTMARAVASRSAGSRTADRDRHRVHEPGDHRRGRLGVQGGPAVGCRTVRPQLGLPVGAWATTGSPQGAGRSARNAAAAPGDAGLPTAAAPGDTRSARG